MKTISALLLNGAIVLTMACSCNGSNQDKATGSKQDFISESAMRMLAIDTAVIRNIDDELKLSGEVSFDENKVVKIYPFSSGQITAVHVSVGDYVKSGQKLATIKSADIAGNYADLSIAGNDVAIAEKDMQNKERLFKNGIASEKEYLESKENYHKARANAAKIKEQLLINGEEILLPMVPISSLLPEVAMWWKKGSIQGVLSGTTMAAICLPLAISAMCGYGLMCMKQILPG
ncbi:efflux RND transporter periplasmic adaptor subunit [Paraflavitalea speifideaquila]|uniref:efflux RND transporter periplasmic adaptor subunit n=1 Tax=Paraflavitalea speifideaquila TaxID=3076558 RepID=UPI0028E7F5E2|nr:efflux RND transporter periplasmic adaptor subunit [Paraflavitalea speifideiaquila]